VDNRDSEDVEMWEIVFTALSGLLILLGVSIFSALVVGKRTEQLSVRPSREDGAQSCSPFVVHFPDAVLRRSGMVER